MENNIQKQNAFNMLLMPLNMIFVVLINVFKENTILLIISGVFICIISIFLIVNSIIIIIKSIKLKKENQDLIH